MHLGVGLAPNYTLYYPARGQKNMVLIVITGRECTVLLSPNAKNQKGMKLAKKGKLRVLQTQHGSLYKTFTVMMVP